jgi:hypothetical protein
VYRPTTKTEEEVEIKCNKLINQINEQQCMVFEDFYVVKTYLPTGSAICGGGGGVNPGTKIIHITHENM